ncbi:hypothetical protein [Leptospira phage LE3]|uniref:Uncharacterized protein n=1 Tax=Leptospira phage LE3 TaxID=2041382 RepID=A0A343LE82_9CAUD|nr:hypothetical protein HWB33_gp02 [Leptospira phage LE3]ATN94992.1 hypothetical protein [Leptospira phage LE3]
MNYHFCNVNFIRDGQVIRKESINASLNETDSDILYRVVQRLKKDMIELKYHSVQIDKVEL